MRHGQAEHNVDANYALRDPSLTDLGLQQSCEFQYHIRTNHRTLADDIELVVVSPLRRTVQTALNAYSWLIEKGVPFMIDADWQENSTNTCDVGSDPKALKEEFPTLDFSTLSDPWPAKEGPLNFSQAGIEARANRVRSWLKSRPERVIAVVSHAAFLRVGIHHARWANADFRIFEFETGPGNELVQWPLTEERGGGMGRSQKGVHLPKPEDFLNAEEQAKLQGKVVEG